MVYEVHASKILRDRKECLVIMRFSQAAGQACSVLDGWLRRGLFHRHAATLRRRAPESPSLRALIADALPPLFAILLVAQPITCSQIRVFRSRVESPIPAPLTNVDSHCWCPDNCHCLLLKFITASCSGAAISGAKIVTASVTGAVNEEGTPLFTM